MRKSGREDGESEVYLAIGGIHASNLPLLTSILTAHVAIATCRREPAPGILLFPHNHRAKAERRRRSLAKYADQGRRVPRPHAILEDMSLGMSRISTSTSRSVAADCDAARPHLSPLRVMGAVWPAAWAETEVATVLHRLDEQALSFHHGHVLVKSFGDWYTHAVQGSALRYAAARRISALLRATLKRWRTVAREAREMFFADAWFAEHYKHWAMAAAVRRWHEKAAW